jgi:hypothetical protein
MLQSLVRLGIPSGTSSSGYPIKTFYAVLLHPERAIYLTHLIFLDFIL